MQIDVHVLEDQVDVLVVASPNHFFEPDDVGVPQLPQKHDFAVGSLGIGGVGKGVKIFLKGLDTFGFLIGDFPDVAVGAAADLLDDVVLLKNVGFNLLSHIFICYNFITDL